MKTQTLNDPQEVYKYTLDEFLEVTWVIYRKFINTRDSEHHVYVIFMNELHSQAHYCQITIKVLQDNQSSSKCCSVGKQNALLMLKEYMFSQMFLV